MAPLEPVAEEAELPPRIAKSSPSDELASSGDEDEDVKEQVQRPRLVSSRFQRAVRMALRHHQSQAALGGLEPLRRPPRRHGSESFFALAPEEQAFVSSVLTAEPVMRGSSRFLLQPGGKLALQDSAVVARAVHQAKLSTARHCWSAHVQPLQQLRESHEQLKEQFKSARSEYLRDITALRDQIRQREDPNCSMEPHADIVSFYDPSWALEPSELEFLSKAVSEKVRMIFETTPGVQGFNSTQLASLLQRQEGNEVKELKAALKRSMAETEALRAQLRDLEAEEQSRRAAAAAAAGAASAARAEAARAEAAVEVEKRRAVEEAAEDAAVEEEEPGPSFLDLVLHGMRGAGGSEASTAATDGEEHHREYGDTEAADYFLLQRRFRRQQEACRVAQEASRQKDSDLGSLRTQLGAAEGQLQQVCAQASRQRHALQISEAGCRQRAAARAARIGELPRCASWPGGMLGSYCLVDELGQRLHRGRTFPVSTRETRCASRGPMESPRARARRKGQRARLPKRDYDLELELEPAQDLFEALWEAWSPGAAQAAEEVPVKLNPPAKCRIPAPRPTQADEGASPREGGGEARNDHMLQLLNGAEIQVRRLAVRCQDLEEQQKVASREKDELRRILWESRKDDVRRLAEDALFESGDFQKVEALLERSPRQASIGTELARTRLAAARSNYEAASAKLRAELDAGHELTSADVAWLQRVEEARTEVIRSKRQLRHAEMKFAIARCEEASLASGPCEDPATGEACGRPGCFGCTHLEKVAGLLSTMRGHSKELCSRFQDSVAENVQLIEAFDELQTEVAGSAAMLKESAALGSDPELRAILISLEEAGRQTVYDRLSGNGRWLSERFAEQRRKYSEESKQQQLCRFKLDVKTSTASTLASDQDDGLAAHPLLDSGVWAEQGGEEAHGAGSRPDPRPPACQPAARKPKRAARASIKGLLRRNGEKEGTAAHGAVASPCGPGSMPDSPEDGGNTAIAAAPGVLVPSRSCAGTRDALGEAPARGAANAGHVEGHQEPKHGSQVPMSAAQPEPAGSSPVSPSEAPPTTTRGARRWHSQASSSMHGPLNVPQPPPQQAPRPSITIMHSLVPDASLIPELPPPQAGLATPRPLSSPRSPSPPPPMTHRRSIGGRDSTSTCTSGRPSPSLPAIVNACPGFVAAARHGRAHGQATSVLESREMLLGATMQ